MKVMIAYDGSGYADAAIHDLPRAGLPHDSEVLVATVVDPSTSKPAVSEFDLVSAASRRMDVVLSKARQQESQVFEDAEDMVSRVAGRLREQFPEWNVATDVLRGKPADQVLAKAAAWEPDLIVVGSQGRSAIGRFFLGSVSKSIAERASCSVRIVREGFARTDTERGDIVIGVKEAQEARMIVEAISDRAWKSETRIRIVAVDGDSRSLYEETAKPLIGSGMEVSIDVGSGDPNSIWLDAVEASRPDAIFVARNKANEPSLSADALNLVTRAGCTVEIVRA